MQKRDDTITRRNVRAVLDERPRLDDAQVASHITRRVQTLHLRHVVRAAKCRAAIGK